MPKTNSASGSRPAVLARRIVLCACGALVVLVMVAACATGAPDLDQPGGTLSPTRTATPAG